MQYLTKQYYQEEVKPKLQKALGLDNSFAVPKLTKIIINTGVTQPIDPKARKAVVENVAEQFAQIAGQKPQITLAKQSISGFKLRQGDPVGVVVTLRGERMWNFLQKLIVVALPRVKDFRGLSLTAFDGRGNYSMGIDEQIIFPEINYDKIDRVRSLQVNIVTSSTDDKQAHALLEMLGLPFAKENK